MHSSSSLARPRLYLTGYAAMAAQQLTATTRESGRRDPIVSAIMLGSGTLSQGAAAPGAAQVTRRRVVIEEPVSLSLGKYLDDPAGLSQVLERTRPDDRYRVPADRSMPDCNGPG